jgi:beta-lactamase regulating signal transducer with metallopeptidase domain
LLSGWEASSLLLALWLAGTLVCWSLAALRLWRLSRLLRTLPPSAGELARRIDCLAARLYLWRKPLAYLVPGVMPPMLLVLGRSSRLLLPADLWERLDAMQRDTLLLHELAHLRRADHRVRWLELVVLGLYWWHPVAWWACRALRDAEEECCDAWVVWAAPEAGPAYAATLVETVAYLSGAPAALPAGASGAGPVRLIKRRLTMILRGSTPRCLSRPALVAMLLLGVGLLPLVPTLAQSGPLPPPPEFTGAVVGQRFVNEMQSCQSCHQAVRSGQKKVQVDTLHDEVVRLMDEVTKHRDQLARAEARLKDALKHFEHEQAKKAPPQRPRFRDLPPSDRRLDDVEKKLELLLKEVEKLRKDLRPGRRSSSSHHSDAMYTRTREITMPVKWNPNVPENNRKVRLYVTTNGGKNYGIVGSHGFRRESGRITSISYQANFDGEFGFLLVTPDQEGKIGPEMVEGKQPMMRVIVDTVPPKVVLQSYEASKGKEQLWWEVTDANLDLDSMRLEYRTGDEKEWKELSKPLTAKGTCDLWSKTAPWEVRLRTTDKAGNVGEATLKLPARSLTITN